PFGIAAVFLLIFLSVASWPLGLMALLLLRRTESRTIFMHVATFTAAWILSGVTALACNIFIATLEAGVYDYSAIGFPAGVVAVGAILMSLITLFRALCIRTWRAGVGSSAEG
uniref:hypothetical protein n=1 Tax=Microbacterium gubbeenense TaxID=159896 RepID=UPI001B7F9E3E